MVTHLYQHDYRPGRTYLAGQYRPDYLTAAERQREQAWKDFSCHVDRMPEGGINANEGYACRYFYLQQQYKDAVEFADQMQDLWDAEQIAIPVALPANVKAEIV